MTYFDDINDFNRLTEKYQTAVKNDAQLLRLQEALDGPRNGYQGFGEDSFI